MKDKLCERLKKLRKESGLSQAEVADYLEISRQSISQWENGRSYPDIANLVILCKLYKINLNELLELDEGITQEQIEDIVEKEEKKSIYKEENATLLDKLTVSVEILTVVVILAISSQIAFLGMIVPIIVVMWGKKHQKNSKMLYFACIIGFMIGTYNTYRIINYYFLPDLGTYTIEPK